VRALDDARGYLESRLIPSYAEHRFGLYLVVRKYDEESLGMCGLVKRPALLDADLGFAFLERHRGNGYAIEAARATLDFAHGTLGLPRSNAARTMCVRTDFGVFSPASADAAEELGQRVALEDARDEYFARSV